jgi:hypothetical protein
MKKVYFACSIRSGRDDQPLYAELVKAIKQHAVVLSEFFVDPSLTSWGYDGATDDKIWQKNVEWIKEADAVIAEVSTPSLGVGYEIAKAEEWSKPVLALYRRQEGKRLSAMISGSPATKVVSYDKLEEAVMAISKFMEK